MPDGINIDINTDRIADEVAQRVNQRLSTVIPTELGELAEQLFRSAREERRRVQALVSLVTRGLQGRLARQAAGRA